MKSSISFLSIWALGGAVACGDGPRSFAKENDRDTGVSATDAGGDGAPAGEAGAGAEVDAGPPVTFQVFVRNLSEPGDLVTSEGNAVDIVFAPGVFVVRSGGGSLFESGAPASAALERLAEDGDASQAIEEASAAAPVAGPFGADELGVSYDAAAIGPGAFADLVFQARPGERLEFAMMWGQSNDIFVATPEGGVALFDEQGAILGDRTAEVSLWDAGTEVNQEPGAGDAQAPRQPSPDFGTEENGTVRRLVSGEDEAGHAYPPLADSLRVEFTIVP